MNSLGQDIIYAVTNGKVKPPKHITLPFAVKSLTGNTELIHMLNRLGHSVSYSQLEEIDTALCLQKLCMYEGFVALPKKHLSRTNPQNLSFSRISWIKNKVPEHLQDLVQPCIK